MGERRSGFFHSAQFFWESAVLYVSIAESFLLMSGYPLHGYTTVYLYIQLLMENWIVCRFAYSWLHIWESVFNFLWFYFDLSTKETESLRLTPPGKVTGPPSCWLVQLIGWQSRSARAECMQACVRKRGNGCMDLEHRRTTNLDRGVRCVDV